ncbi:hypothetical protein F5Y13DRAFT_130782 [Hypoxylon sp. FL1857]|nr:hypothetical protein F5Y13DRAFT_130782 [Hypoxylon sp. FL1857]
MEGAWEPELKQQAIQSWNETIRRRSHHLHVDVLLMKMLTGDTKFASSALRHPKREDRILHASRTAGPSVYCRSSEKLDIDPLLQQVWNCPSYCILGS